MLDHSKGTWKWKYKKGHFFDFVLKVMVCSNLETFEIYGKHLQQKNLANSNLLLGKNLGLKIKETRDNDPNPNFLRESLCGSHRLFRL